MTGRRTRRLGCLLLPLLGLLGWAGPGAAHQMNVSSARVMTGADRKVEVEIAMKGSDIDRVAGTAIVDPQSGEVRPAALAEASPRVAAYVRAHSSVSGAEGRECAPGPSTVAPDADGAAVRTTWDCAEIPGKLHYRSTVLIDSAPSARQVVLLRSEGSIAQDLLDSSRPEIALTEAPSPSLLQVMLRFVAAGVEHIAIGYDHIAFLIAIMLWARRIGPVVKMVTAFTVAHSITLSLAALDVVRIPSSIVEPAIAASIVFVAVENFLSRDVQRRWRVTFLFGLIHGFGFASALQEVGLPRSAIVPALAAFNIGVELGQIAIVAVVVPLLLLMDRAAERSGRAPTRPALAVHAISAAIIVLGSYWFLIRTVFEA